MTRLRTKPKAFNRRRCGRELLCRPRERNGGAETERRRYVSHASITGIALGPFQHLLVSACGAPIILSALTGHVFNVITQVGGGDEVWHNPGDNRFFVTAADSVTGVQALGVIDAETNTWLQNVSDVRGRNPSAFPENNHIFNAVTAPVPPSVEDPKSPCAQFGLIGRGCIAVFGHDDE